MKLRALLRVFTCLLVTLPIAEACGPDFSPDIFVRAQRPDRVAQYAAGELGILEPSFPRADLLVAYRYLNGGTLNTPEQQSWQPPYAAYDPEAPSDAEPAQSTMAQWVLARATYPDAPPGPIGGQRALRVHTPQGYEYDAGFLNCGEDAFRTAAATLRDRAARWGERSALLLDWLHAQDAVFANCSNGSATPAPAPAGAPGLLAADRAYQRAAAEFYSLRFAQAAEAFRTISADPASPWQPRAGYLVARVLVRQAFLSQTQVAAQAEYDPALMHQAADQLHTYLAGRPSAALAVDAEALLALVRIRLEPEQRARELSALLAGPGHDPNYGQDLQDLLWLLDARTPDGLRAQPGAWLQVPDEQHPHQLRLATPSESTSEAKAARARAWTAIASLRALSPAIDWTLTLQSLDPSAAVHAIREWRQTHALPWLVAALTLAPDKAAAPAELLDAAERVSLTSPAWQTVTYHRARLLLASGSAEQARTLLADALPRVRQPSSINAFRGLQMQAAPTLESFLSYAPRSLLLATSEENANVQECNAIVHHTSRHYHCVAQPSSNQFDRDAVGILNTSMPISVWIDAAQSSALSPELRQAIAETAWTRAVLLDDQAAADTLLALLPTALRAEAGRSSKLQQWTVLARNPGLTPYLNAGIQRSYSYDFVESYRDNWCYKPPEADPGLAAAFLAPAQRSAAALENASLAPMRSVRLGQRILGAVQAEPGDPQAAEVLFLTLRMIRYGCVEPAPALAAGSEAPAATEEAQELFRLRKDVSRLLRRRYAASPWTKRAAPFAD